ncbi:hypothetical protein [Corynebacterium tapiri]|uniref:ATP/GTP-binding protein n=1 Tax=Corynebacterium tapiri TaxID=1448266 RepID=A0A5C4U769_9CORY|nr:hypothetical protein [Corynebacterium tapiri]TNL99744.1 hypothetical protein FHE74_01515 [Corynebacterium tapiri]
MGRKNRRAPARSDLRPITSSQVFGTQLTSGPRWDRQETYCVRVMSADRATKVYICAGCNQTIQPGITHKVAWPRDSGARLDDRRHWHSGCWERR